MQIINMAAKGTLYAIIVCAILIARCDYQRENTADPKSDNYNMIYSDNTITSFSVANPNAPGIINETDSTITVTVPYGTNLSNLVALFETNGSSVAVNGIEQESGITPNNFSGPLYYDVTSMSGTVKTYRVSVIITLIDSFSFDQPAVSGIINEQNSSITLFVPYGTDVSSLKAVFSSSGPVSVGSVTQESGVTVNDFTYPLTYSVEGPDGSTKDYLVTVDTLRITSFSLVGITGSAIIDDSNSTITVSIPYETYEAGVSNLKALFTTNGVSITVNDIQQISGTSTNNFSDPVIYTVTAQDGLLRYYTVTVLPGIISSFTFNGIEEITTVINEASRTIEVEVPYFTDLSALVADFSLPPGITLSVNGTQQVSGSTANDYTGPLTVTATSDGGINRDYTVDVTHRALYAGYFAGPDKGGAGSNDGTSGEASFDHPGNLTTDGTNLYVADTWNHTIRKTVIATGEVTTLAGTAGIAGSADGTGSAARFNNPKGITTDGTNLYVTDTDNHTIRKISTATGEVTTLAGLAGSSGSADGVGSAARFNAPIGITSDGIYLYITDSLNHTIRKINIALNSVTTLAGLAGSSGSADGTGAAARFFAPIGIITDGTYLYVADTIYQTIRKITAEGVVTTLTASPGYGITTDGTYLYVADRNNHTISRIVIADGQVSTIAGSASNWGSADGIGPDARFNYPQGITTDGTYLYVADWGNCAIRRISIASAEVTTLAGLPVQTGSTDGTGPSARFDLPGAITGDGTYLYVADDWNHTIRRIVIATREVTTFAGSAGSAGSADGTGTAARFNRPSGIAIDGTDLYVADTLNHTIRRIVIASGEVTTFAGSAGSAGSADDTGTAASFNNPFGITTDGTNLYVADRGNHSIRKIVIATGEVTTLAGAGSSGSADGTGTEASFNSPHGITTDGTYLYVVDMGNYTIRRIVIATGVVTTLAGSGSPGSADGTGTAASFNSSYGITADGTDLYVTDSGNHTIRRIVVSTGEVTTIAGTATKSGSVAGRGAAARFNMPTGIFKQGTSLYISDAYNRTIRILSP